MIYVAWWVILNIKSSQCLILVYGIMTYFSCVYKAQTLFP